MGKSLYIAEKPSVAREFARVLKITGRSADGYLESADGVVTWCVGHLVTMSYPESYDSALKKWRLDTLPFMPETFKYEVIPDVKSSLKLLQAFLIEKILIRFTYAPTPGVRVSIFTALWMRWPVLRIR